MTMAREIPFPLDEAEVPFRDDDVKIESGAVTQSLYRRFQTIRN
jgi:hypothetical protein